MGNEKSQGSKPLVTAGISEANMNKVAYSVMRTYSNKSSNSQNTNINQSQQGISVYQQNPTTQYGRFTTIISKPKPKFIITSAMLKNVFKTFAIDNNYLNKDRFNDAIERIFCFPGLPEMHYTYLSDKIYTILDDSGDGKIQEGEFIDGFSNVLSDREFRIKLCMMAMMTLPDKTRDSITMDEIKEFFYHSWVQGYKHLGWKIQRQKNEFIKQGLPSPTIKQFEIWAKKSEREVKNSIEQDLRENGVNMNNIDSQTFKNWLFKDHTIYIMFANRSVNIATSLTSLDEIGYEEQGSNNMQQNMQPSNYPSF